MVCYQEQMVSGANKNYTTHFQTNIFDFTKLKYLCLIKFIKNNFMAVILNHFQETKNSSENVINPLQFNFTLMRLQRYT